MPEDDVSDLRDVVEAINKLCETMKTSYDDYEECEDDTEATAEESTYETALPSISHNVDSYLSDDSNITDDVSVMEPVTYKTVLHMNYTSENTTDSELESAEAICEQPPRKMETTVEWSDTVKEPDVSCSKSRKPETWSDRVIKPVEFTSECVAVTVVQPRLITVNDDIRNIVTEKKDREDIEVVSSDTELAAEHLSCEPTSEMYYTASSEVSLLSDTDTLEKGQSEDCDKEKDDRNSVIAGHVAAMRERFESMTRTNTPCPDLMRSASPSFELLRNIGASPDHLE